MVAPKGLGLSWLASRQSQDHTDTEVEGGLYERAGNTTSGVIGENARFQLLSRRTVTYTGGEQEDDSLRWEKYL